jgi:hypothetical protein
VERPAWLQSAIQWANEELYEYVEISATDAEVDKSLTSDDEGNVLLTTPLAHCGALERQRQSCCCHSRTSHIETPRP